MGRPLGEVAFLLPGPGYHLLTAPGGLPGAVPFGVPMAHIGPGGLYLELGLEFSPSLPDGARQARFRLQVDTVVAVVQQAAYRFEVARLTPAWSLWVGEAPAVQEGLSPQGERLLAGLARAIRQAEATQVEPSRPDTRPVDRTTRIRLLEQAQRAELAGNLIRAAELLEQAGYPGPAGRLYERAAAAGST